MSDLEKLPLLLIPECLSTFLLKMCTFILENQIKMNIGLQEGFIKGPWLRCPTVGQRWTGMVPGKNATAKRLPQAEKTSVEGVTVQAMLGCPHVYPVSPACILGGNSQ